MNIIQRIAHWLINKAKETPYIHLDGYMERYWLVPYSDTNLGEGCFEAKWYKHPFTWLLQKFGVSIRVHHILSSDDDRAYHDHPWSSIRIILTGGYWDLVPRKDKSGIYIGPLRTWKKAGSIRFCPASSWHRIELSQGVTPWTLFITFKKQQSWGFSSQNDKVYYKDYLREKNHG